jgi:hypothetical protein
MWTWHLNDNVEQCEKGAMYITFKEYLQQMESLEKSRPKEQRRRIPSIVALAEAIGVHPATLSNIANNNVVRFTLETGAAIIDEMRRRGFAMEASDLVGYRPADEDPV